MTFDVTLADSFLIDEEGKNFQYDNDGNRFYAKDVLLSIIKCNNIIKKFDEVFYRESDMRLFEVIDKKQTGAFIGAIFISKFCEDTKYIAKNPSQTGSPDLIPSQYLNFEEELNWDQFPYGGIEVKTSCGDLPSKKTQELSIGSPRISFLNNVVWKGHHNEINNLLGLYWDYAPIPSIFAAFYSNELEPSDFTNTVPKEDGGHTTNVCITKASAREKMGKNWVVLPKNEVYLTFFKKKFSVLSI
jgi:hypothetical protein